MGGIFIPKLFGGGGQLKKLTVSGKVLFFSRLF